MGGGKIPLLQCLVPHNLLVQNRILSKGLICKLLYGIVFLIHKHNQYLTGIQLAFGTDIKIPTPNGRLTEVTHFNGNIVLIPQYVYHILGNLDYYFTHSKGDFDYGLRAQKKGIKMFQVGEVLGECDLHETLDKWCNPDIPFKQRWKALHLHLFEMYIPVDMDISKID